MMSPSNPTWLQEYRAANLLAFERRGLPTRKNERWKYADLSLLTNFTAPPSAAQEVDQFPLKSSFGIGIRLYNGYLQPHLTRLPDQIVVCTLAEAIVKYETQVMPLWARTVDCDTYPFASFNAAQAQHGLFIYVPDHCRVSEVLHIVNVIDGTENFVAYPRHVVILGKESRLQVVEELVVYAEKTGFSNRVNNLHLAAGAHLEYYKLHNNTGHFEQLEHTFVHQEQQSHSRLTRLNYGGRFSREDLEVTLAGAHAACCTHGFYHLSGASDYHDNHIDILHKAPHTRSEMLYKGVIEQHSRAVFNGRLYVEENAQKVQGYQANHNLLLSAQAECYSKPELEIYADDVKCKHGASTGQIDEEALFYLRSRGIPQAEARTMLLAGFADEVLEKISDPLIKRYIQEWLPC